MTIVKRTADVKEASTGPYQELKRATDTLPDKKEIEHLVVDLRMRLKKLENEGLNEDLRLSLAETIASLEEIIGSHEVDRLSAEGSI